MTYQELFFQWVLTPTVLLITQIILICLNKYTIDQGDRLGLFKSIIWTIITILIFPSILMSDLLVNINYVFALPSLGLMFLQIFMNTEFILIDYETRKPKRSYR